MARADVAAHQVKRTLEEEVWYAAHPPREESAEYRRVHHHLIFVLDEGCWICGVSHSTLSHPKVNTHGAGQMETHHDDLEWAFGEGGSIDPEKLYADFPAMGAATDEALRRWLDSEGNLMVLCDVHHRHRYYGIHEVTYPVWKPQRWLFDGWDLRSGPPRRKRPLAA